MTEIRKDLTHAEPRPPGVCDKDTCVNHATAPCGFCDRCCGHARGICAVPKNRVVKTPEGSNIEYHECFQAPESAVCSCGRTR